MVVSRQLAMAGLAKNYNNLCVIRMKDVKQTQGL